MYAQRMGQNQTLRLGISQSFACGACGRTIPEEGNPFMERVRQNNPHEVFLKFAVSMGRCPICLGQVSQNETPDWIVQRANNIFEGRSEENVERCPPGAASGSFIDWRF